MKKLLLLLCFCLFSLNNSAQNSAKDKLGSWYMYNGSHKLSEKFALKTMAHYRYFELASEFQQSIYRLGINYKLNSKINFTAGISYADTDTEYLDTISKNLSVRVLCWDNFKVCLNRLVLPNKKY